MMERFPIYPDSRWNAPAAMSFLDVELIGEQWAHSKTANIAKYETPRSPIDTGDGTGELE